MSQSIISVIFSLLFVMCSLWSACVGQLAFHTDPQTNSFSLKAPGYQQTFTRYFGGQQGGLFQQQQAAASQPQEQIAPAPQNYYQQSQPAAYQQSYPGAYAQQQPQASQQQPQFISAQDYAAYLQQTQQQQAQPLQYNQPSPQYEQQPQASTQNAAVSAEPQQQDPNLLGVAFSPSNQVSHVKFSSSGLSYNF